MTQVPLEAGFMTATIASGPDGEIWFGGYSGGFGSITTAGLSILFMGSGRSHRRPRGGTRWESVAHAIQRNLRMTPGSR